jgi:aryl-alcohol dehydrogenase-like predicted oxidoreductase
VTVEIGEHGAIHALTAVTCKDQRVIGLGCMRLSTEPARDEAAALALLGAALDAGITLLDTADAYCLDAAEAGHNERLVARAATGRRGVEIATKIGLVRPGGRWENDGRARHLAAACEASRAALGVETIDLLQLHAPDPRVPLATSVRALAALREAGKARAIGLCNVSRAQLDEACAIAAIDAVQIRFDDDLVRACLARGIRVLAYRPLGGVAGVARLARDPLLVEIAVRHGATPAEVQLAWLASRGVTPLPGPTRLETARSCAAAARLALDVEDRARLDERLRPRPVAVAVPRGEVVLIAGTPAAGKSTLAADFVAAGYERLNRDLRGGSLDGLAQELERRIAAGGRRFVLDNTYATRRARATALAAAARHGLGARCILLDTSLEDAQWNACERMLAAHGRLLGPEEMKARREPPPRALFEFRRTFEPPAADEGFTEIETRRFVRRVDAARAGRAMLLSLDGPAWDRDRLAALRADGWKLLGFAWRPDGGGAPAAHDLLDDVVVCPHPGGPPICWCRKPIPGLAVSLIVRHGLDPARCVVAGAATLDRTLAGRMGMAWTGSI